MPPELRNPRISVIIPFFQRQAGVLRRAATSVMAQQFAKPADVELLVVDDASPVRAAADLAGLSPPPWLTIRIIEQANAGPAAARNRGLDAMRPDADFIAFLDSDDEWRPRHLATGVQALERGQDFYFCDSAMPPSTLFAGLDLFRTPLDRRPFEPIGDDLHRFAGRSAALPMLREYLCQTSSVILRAAALGELRFDEGLRHAGEDWLMWVRLAHRVDGVCFSIRANSLRGEGINLYRDAHDRLTGANLRRIVTMIRANQLMAQTPGLAREGKDLVRARIRTLEIEAAAIMMHPALYRACKDAQQRRIVLGAWRRMGAVMPLRWPAVLLRRLGSPAPRSRAQPA